jgi:chromate transporter
MEGAAMTAILISLAVIFAQLSLLAFGGGNTILPEMQRQVVDIHHWMSARDFTAMFALAQAAPGPNMMVVTLVGWHVAGWPGVLVTSLAKFGPSSILTGLVMQAWQRFKDHPWRRIVQAALVPMTVGLVAASAALITVASDHEWVLAAITAVSALVMVTTRVHPLWMLAAGALAGLSGIGLP